MKAINYLTNLINWGNAFVPFTLAESVRNAAMALGYAVCAGAYDADNNTVTLYLNR